MNIRLSVCSALLCLGAAHPAGAQVPTFDHIFVIVMENHEYGDIVGSADAPYINSLARQYGLETSYFAIAHPSLPNYMAVTGGDTFFTTDCVGCETSAVNLGDRIEASGRTWTAYMEDMPTTCGTTDSGLYATKHDPFIHYTDIVSNASRCASHVVPFSNFGADLAANRLSNFVWITPNLCSDMHDCPVSTGDSWLASLVPQILQSPSFSNSVLFLVWDEGVTNDGGGGHVPLIVVSPATPAGLQSSATANHYSVLRTIEDAWSLAPLGQSASALSLAQFFPAPAVSPSDQVIHASDVTSFIGAWRKVPDSTAADGVKLATADNGAATLDAPLASPASYFDATFTAQPGARYRVWLRIHAANDSKWNDSVFLQFSDSVDAGGSPIYRIGTTTGYVVNLWTCSTCQSIGWGWQRNAYWLADSGDVWFPTGGAHTIRVQPREDGVEIDQIVISPSTWVDAAPGPASGDGTIVPRTGGGPPPPPPPPPPQPPPSSVPAPWQDQDVGSTGLAGNATYTNGTFTVQGAGGDIWGTADAFNYVSQGISGDVQVVARVTSLQDTNMFAKAGIMLRTSTSAGSAHVILDVRPTGDVEFMTRASNDGATNYLAGAVQSLPVWLRLARTGSTVTGAVSADGSTWRVVGSTGTSIPSSALAGLVVTSHDTSVLNTATFDNAAVGGSAPPVSGDIVIYAADVPASTTHGAWTRQSDATAAAGIALATPNAGVANTSAPLAAPIDYFDVTFDASASTPYRLWLRLKALNNDKFNDSVWVQFSDATSGGAAVYRTGTVSGLLVNLATDSTAASLINWGWQDGAYWLSQSTTMTFASSGTHSLRIQVREDGVAIDQIVLSPARYLTSAPGGATNDSTIVPR